MNVEEFTKIMSDSETDGAALFDLNDDNVFVGLTIIRKYMPKKGIEGSDKDIIYSVAVRGLVAAGITKEDALYLRSIGWEIAGGYSLACRPMT